MPDELPYLRVMPINNRMDPHERRPAPIRGIEMRQLPAVRIRPSRSDKYGLDLRLHCQVIGEGGFHALAGEVCEGEVVREGRGGDECGDFGEGVWRDDVDGFEMGWEIWVVREGCEVDYEEDEAVFAAVIGQREGWETYGYLSRASRTTSRAIRVCACTGFSFSVWRSC